jgi:hypothetical protein
MGAAHLCMGAWKDGEMFWLGSPLRNNEVSIDSEDFASFGCGVACVIESWGLLMLRLKGLP